MQCENETKGTVPFVSKCENETKGTVPFVSKNLKKVLTPATVGVTLYIEISTRK